MLKKRGFAAFMALLVAALALVAAGCGGGGNKSAGGGTTAAGTTGGGGGGGGGGGVEALPSSSCTGVEFKGSGKPDVLIVTDLPLQGSSRAQSLQIVKATRFILGQRNWKAGSVNVGYQSCDDSTAQAAKWDSGKCSQNAQAYAGNSKVIGVIGTFNSGCAAIEIPVLNQAPGGAIPMVSPANTFVCLTEGGPGCESSEPAKYYPTGTRNYFRVVAHDIYQGAAVAEFAKKEGVKKIFILNDKEAYGLGVARRFQNALKAVGIKEAGFAAWDPKSSSYEALMRQIKQTGADAVFLGGLTDENGAQVIKDKVAVLGPNTGKVKLFAPDGFTQQSTITEAGVDNAKGMYMSVAGVPTSKLTGEGKTFITAFQKELGSEKVDPYAAYGGQAAEVLVKAIETAGAADRAKVIDALKNTNVTNGILGSFKINKNGDPTLATGGIVGFTIYRAEKQLVPETTITPSQKTIDAARGT
jgi:branched-chain amino acid transport system substrate-binding protein